MSKKKVLFIAPRFHTNQFYLVKKLLEKEVEVNFLSVYVGGSENHKYVKPILSRPSALIRWFIKNKDPKYASGREVLRKYSITSFRQCFNVYKELSPDIIIVRNLRYFISMQHFFIGILLGKKVFLYTLNNYKQHISKRRKLFYRSLSIFGVKHYTPVLGDVNAPSIPNTYYIPFVMEKMVDNETVIFKNKNDGIQIMTIGKMNDQKKIKELVDSLFRINFFDKKNNTLTIVSECIGEQHEKYLESVKKSILKNESQVKFHLNIAHSKVFELLKKSDLFVLASHKELAGTCIHEAMACGLAVVTSNSNGTQCYIENGVNGYVFRFSKDFEDLDEVLIKLMDKNILLNYGLASLKRIDQYHGIDNFYNNVIEK